MKSLNILALSLVTVVSAAAQSTGFFLTVSGGTAQMKTGDFAVYNPVASVPAQPLGEALAVTDKSSRASVARFSLGYVINENWDIQLGYADYGTAKAQVAAPTYPGIVFIVPQDNYTRHELKYDSSVVTLIPTYTHALSNQLKLKIGAGLSYSQTSSHFETTLVHYTSVTNSTTTKNRYAKASQSNLSYLATLGLDYAITDKFSIGLTGTSTTMKAKIPSAPWVNRTKSDVTVSSLGAELTATWHW